MNADVLCAFAVLSLPYPALAAQNARLFEWVSNGGTTYTITITGTTDFGGPDRCAP